ncbi:hypothetical protein JXL19_02880 [bacterium]|nr:hypothetical protein [bacterium]
MDLNGNNKIFSDKNGHKEKGRFKGRIFLFGIVSFFVIAAGAFAFYSFGSRFVKSMCEVDVKYILKPETEKRVQQEGSTPDTFVKEKRKEIANKGRKDKIEDNIKEGRKRDSLSEDDFEIETGSVAIAPTPSLSGGYNSVPGGGAVRQGMPSLDFYPGSAGLQVIKPAQKTGQIQENEKAASTYGGTAINTGVVTGNKTIQENVAGYSPHGGNITQDAKTTEAFTSTAVSETFGTDKGQQNEDTLNPTPWSDPLNPTPWSLEFVCKVIGVPPGEKLMAYTPRGALCGRVDLKEDGTHDGFFHVYIDEADTEREEGLRVGDEIIFMVGDKRIYPMEGGNIVYEGAWGTIKEIELGG